MENFQHAGASPAAAPVNAGSTAASIAASTAGSEYAATHARKKRERLYAGREGFAVLGLAAALGFLARLLLFETAWGVGASIWALAFVVSVLGVATDWSVRIPRDRLWIAASLLVLPFFYTWHSNETLAVANTLAILTLAAVWVSTWLLEQPDRLPFVWTMARLAWLFPSFTLDQAESRLGVAKEHSDTWRLVGRGILYASPFLIFFALLLGEADQRFGTLLETPFNMNWVEAVPSVLFILLSSCLAGTFLLGATRFMRGKDLVKPRRLWLTFDPVEANTVLGLVSALFGAFLFVHFTGSVGIDPNLSAVAAEARAGFFQMAMVAGVSLAMVLTLRTRLRESEGEQFAMFRRLVTLNAALVVLILTSAAIRMANYIATYGWTELRLNTSFAMVWTAAVFAAVILAHASSIKINIPKTGIVSALVLLFAMHAINPHAFIASRNIDAAFGEQIASYDASYLADLSADAVPAIVTRWNKISPHYRGVIASQWADRYGIPVTYQGERFFNVLQERGLDWRAWTISESRAGGWLADDRVERARASGEFLLAPIPDNWSRSIPDAN